MIAKFPVKCSGVDERGRCKEIGEVLPNQGGRISWGPWWCKAHSDQKSDFPWFMHAKVCQCALCVFSEIGEAGGLRPRNGGCA